MIRAGRLGRRPFSLLYRRVRRGCGIGNGTASHYGKGVACLRRKIYGGGRRAVRRERFLRSINGGHGARPYERAARSERRTRRFAPVWRAFFTCLMGRWFPKKLGASASGRPTRGGHLRIEPSSCGTVGAVILAAEWAWAWASFAPTRGAPRAAALQGIAAAGAGSGAALPGWVGRLEVCATTGSLAGRRGYRGRAALATPVAFDSLRDVVRIARVRALSYRNC